MYLYACSKQASKQTTDFPSALSSHHCKQGINIAPFLLLVFSLFFLFSSLYYFSLQKSFYIDHLLDGRRHDSRYIVTHSSFITVTSPEKDEMAQLILACFRSLRGASWRCNAFLFIDFFYRIRMSHFSRLSKERNRQKMAFCRPACRLLFPCHRLVSISPREVWNEHGRGRVV